MNVEILVKQLRLYASHGVLPQERVVGANFYVTLTATVQVSDDALLHDKLQGTVDYGQIVEVLHRVAVDGVCVAEAQVILVATLGHEERVEALVEHGVGVVGVDVGDTIGGSLHLVERVAKVDHVECG